VPLRSLNRSSGCGARTAGFCDNADVAEATEVNEEELPHNSRTVEETGSVRSLAWNSERNAGEELAGVEAEAIATGVTVRALGNVER